MQPNDRIDVNWSRVFGLLFGKIDGPKGSQFYYGGKDFTEKLKLVSPRALDYDDLIAQRNAHGRSTARKVYFRELFFELSEEQKTELVLRIISDLEVRGHAPCADIRSLLGTVASVEVASVPDTAWQRGELDELLKQLDFALENKNSKRVLTLAYTYSEGLLKAFVRKNVPEKSSEHEIVALHKIARDWLREKYPAYPGELLNILSQTGHALNRIRDGFSDAHFGNEAELWVAGYVRDLVHTQAKLLSHFIYLRIDR